MYVDDIKRLKEKIMTAEAIVIGAGAGLSTAAGFIYDGETFKKYFFDFIEEYDITDIYSGGFYPFSDKEIMWAWWSRHIYFNRYVKAPKNTYNNLSKLVNDRNYFVITTNVDHQFQKADFDKERLFYTQGDYGLWQSVNPRIKKTYDNELEVYKMLESQGFVKNSSGEYDLPDDGKISMRIPSSLIPKYPDDGSDMTMNLRSDDSFVEDEGWHKAANKYNDFITKYKNDEVLYLELGVGMNTPAIIKYPFWQFVYNNKKSTYACVNYGEAVCPSEIVDRSIVINDDIHKVILDLLPETVIQ